MPRAVEVRGRGRQVFGWNLGNTGPGTGNGLEKTLGGQLLVGVLNRNTGDAELKGQLTR